MQEKSYKIVYNLNDGENDKNNPDGYSLNDLPLYLNPASKEGYNFLGWFLNKDYSGIIINTITENYKKDLELFACFEQEIEYKINYETGKGAFDYNSPEALYRDFLTDLYKFVGATEDLNSFMHGEKQNFKGTYSNGNNSINPSFKLYASGYRSYNPEKVQGKAEDYFIYHPDYRQKWLSWFDKIAIFVSKVNSTQQFWQDVAVGYIRIMDWALNLRAGNPYNLDNKMFMPDYQPKRFFTGKEPLILTEPKGSKFLGWYDNPYFCGVKYLVIPSADKGDKKFYARWEEELDADLFVSASWQADKEIIYKGKKLEFNSKAFCSIRKALDKALAGQKIIILEGTYNEDILITKNSVSLLGPNAFANIDNRKEEAVIYGEIKINQNVENLTVNGLAFVNAKLISGNNSGVRFIYNNFSDTLIFSQESIMKDLVFANNIFSNKNKDFLSLEMSHTENLYLSANIFLSSGLKLGISKKAIITENKFSGKTKEALAIKNYLGESLLIKNNTFEINVQAISIIDDSQKESNLLIEISFNRFINLSAKDLIALKCEQQSGKWQVSVLENKFIGEKKNSRYVNFEKNNSILLNMERNYFSCQKSGEGKSYYENSDDMPELNYNDNLLPKAIRIKDKFIEMEIFTEKEINALILPRNSANKKVYYQSSNRKIVTITNEGVIGAKGCGKAVISVISEANDLLRESIEVSVYKPAYLDLYYQNKSYLYIGEEERIVVEKEGLNGLIKFSSSDELIISVDKNGKVIAKALGSAIISASIDNTIYNTIGFTVLPPLSQEDEVLGLLLKNHNSNIIKKKEITVIGYQFMWYTDLFTSINRYLFENNDIIEMIAPITNNNRPQIKDPIINKNAYVTVHDTGSSAKHADALMHSNYVINNSDNSTSWHYSSGDTGIYHQIPDDEVAWHAGDGRRAYNLTNTNIKALSAERNVSIIDGFFAVNDIKSPIKAPKNPLGEDCVTSDIVDQGIRCVIKEGTYWLGDAYYNTGYRKIANTGGNYNSVGIESMINLDSDIYLTWQKTAKLVAKLLIENNLTIDDVKQHNFFSGKDCPQTMRKADFWPHFLENVALEKEILTKYPDYKIEIISGNKELLQSNGRIKNETLCSKLVSFTLLVSKENYKKAIKLYSAVPGKLKD